MSTDQPRRSIPEIPTRKEAADELAARGVVGDAAEQMLRETARGRHDGRVDRHLQSALAAYERVGGDAADQLRVMLYAVAVLVLDAFGIAGDSDHRLAHVRHRVFRGDCGPRLGGPAMATAAAAAEALGTLLVRISVLTSDRAARVTVRPWYVSALVPVCGCIANSSTCNRCRGAGGDAGSSCPCPAHERSPWGFSFTVGSAHIVLPIDPAEQLDAEPPVWLITVAREGLRRALAMPPRFALAGEGGAGVLAQVEIAGEAHDWTPVVNDLLDRMRVEDAARRISAACAELAAGLPFLVPRAPERNGRRMSRATLLHWTLDAPIGATRAELRRLIQAIPIEPEQVEQVARAALRRVRDWAESSTAIRRGDPAVDAATILLGMLARASNEHAPDSAGRDTEAVVQQVEQLVGDVSLKIAGDVPELFAGDARVTADELVEEGSTMRRDLGLLCFRVAEALEGWRERVVGRFAPGRPSIKAVLEAKRPTTRERLLGVAIDGPAAGWRAAAWRLGIE